MSGKLEKGCGIGMASPILSLWPVLFLQPTLQSEMVILSGLCGVRYKSTVAFQEIVSTPHRKRGQREKCESMHTPPLFSSKLELIHSAWTLQPSSTILQKERRGESHPCNDGAETEPGFTMGSMS